MPSSSSNGSTSTTSTAHTNGVISICHYLEGERYVLSVILSYLQEEDGTCFLLTNQYFSRRILPLFHIPHDKIQNHVDHELTDNRRKLKKMRHCFIPYPVQCPSVLLDRLNALRLSRRIRMWKSRSVRLNKNVDVDKNDQNEHKYEHEFPYQFNMTTEEIAWSEWTTARNQYTLQQNPYNHNKSKSLSLSMSIPFISYPAQHELLRYLSPPPPSKTIYNFKPKLQVPRSILSLPIIPPKILPGITLLASYPRSGNTLLRTLLERTTSILTGSDTRPDRTLSLALSTLHSLVGEGITSSKVLPVVKTHFPERRGYMCYNADRVILLVRNPYDAIDSYWNMCCTNTHTESVVEEVYERYRDKWRGLARAEMGVWCKFLGYWLHQCDTTFGNGNGNGGSEDMSSGSGSGSGGPSLLLIRFEDLIQNTQMVMEQVMTFLTVDDATVRGNDSAEEKLHPFWKWRIRRALGLEDDDTKSSSSSSSEVNTFNLGSYKPRSEQENDGRGNAESGTNPGHDAKLSKEGQNEREDSNKSQSKSRNSSFGKSLRKNHYAHDDLVGMHEVAQEQSIEHASAGNVNFLRMLGYDVFHQNFPENLEEKGNEKKTHTDTTFGWDFVYPKCSQPRKTSTVRINYGPELRPPGSEFGRAMTRWRKSQTNNDTEPFETIQKK